MVSFLNADHSTCNGVIPHPTLPLFVTYGIDSTAKLWRATTPVDSEVDDSPTVSETKVDIVSRREGVHSFVSSFVLVIGTISVLLREQTLPSNSVG